MSAERAAAGLRTDRKAAPPRRAVEEANEEMQ
ncbi:hypothetical protein QFZ71_000771 [Streptomyces sp. V2I9]|nr:hypothetical protein [Streptomyces sp. V2I9]